MKRAPEEWKEL